MKITDPKVVTHFRWLLATLRMLYHNYQESHWVASGDVFYGNHLLFQRLYGAVVGEIDAVAERMVGLCGETSIDSVQGIKMMAYWAERWAGIACPITRGIQAEQDLQRVTSDLYRLLDGAGVKTMGVDDLLMTIANTHETHQYLLGRVLAGKHDHVEG